jgi:hypothetical protein
MGQLSTSFASICLAPILALAVGVAVPACGGSEPPPAPLSNHFDDMYIAAIPLDQKQAVVQTQQDWSVGKMENAKAMADLNEAETQVQIARNDQKAAQLNVDSAISTKKSAEASADTNRINQATKDEHAAETALKAAGERVKYMAAYRDWLKILGLYTAENMYWRESQYELAKASLAQKNNIAPKGFVFNNYGSQESDRGKKANHRKERSDSARKHAAEARDAWLKLQEQAERETGKHGTYPDPLAPAAVPVPAATPTPAPAEPAAAAQ